MMMCKRGRGVFGPPPPGGVGHLALSFWCQECASTPERVQLRQCVFYLEQLTTEVTSSCQPLYHQSSGLRHVATLQKGSSASSCNVFNQGTIRNVARERNLNVQKSQA
eukprot:jgi/Botrbrau1/17575/Bobra.0166s0019.1